MGNIIVIQKEVMPVFFMGNSIILVYGNPVPTPVVDSNIYKKLISAVYCGWSDKQISPACFCLVQAWEVCGVCGVWVCVCRPFFQGEKKNSHEKVLLKNTQETRKCIVEEYTKRGEAHVLEHCQACNSLELFLWSYKDSISLDHSGDQVAVIIDKTAILKCCLVYG